MSNIFLHFFTMLNIRCKPLYLQALYVTAENTIFFMLDLFHKVLEAGVHY